MIRIFPPSVAKRILHYTHIWMSRYPKRDATSNILYASSISLTSSLLKSREVLLGCDYRGMFRAQHTLLNSDNE